MRKLILLLVTILLTSISSVITAQENTGEYISVGTPINAEKILSSSHMYQNYQDLKAGDTLNVSFKAEVNSVCENKGCWMKLNLDNEEEVMVKFKDYAFFVPKDIGGKEVIVNGEAYVEEMSVEDQRHYAEDAGASREEIEKIVKPKKTLSFIADGVKIKK